MIVESEKDREGTVILSSKEDIDKYFQNLEANVQD
jgi:hypothetical protein